MKVLHYLNQFFAGIGGEEKADVGLEHRPEPVGPGQLLLRMLSDHGIAAEVQSLICGDTFAAENLDAVTDEILAHVERQQPDLVVLGPAFHAGRYGIVCGHLAANIPARSRTPAITGLYEENPAVGLYQAQALIVKTAGSARGMAEALERIARAAPLLAAGQEIEERAAFDLFSRGIRRNELQSATAAARAVTALEALLHGEDPGTELAVPDFDAVDAAPPLADLTHATVALVTEGGLVPTGNPDKLRTGASDRWGAYPVADLLGHPTGYLSIHGGFDTKHVNGSPFRLVPVDALEGLRSEGAIKRVYDRYFVTSGTATKVANCRQMGAEMAAVLQGDGVDAVILTST